MNTEHVTQADIENAIDDLESACVTYGQSWDRPHVGLDDLTPIREARTELRRLIALHVTQGGTK